MTYYKTKKPLSLILALLMLLTCMATATSSVYADDDIGVGTKVTLKHDHQIRYGSGDGGYSNLMKATGINDTLGTRPVFCTQPSMASPSAGTYTIDKMYTSDTGNADVIRKLVYYAKGYPGWSWAKDKWFSGSGWSDDDIYGIFHIALSYATAGYNDNMKAWGGGTVKGCMYTDNWNKMIEIVNDCKSDSIVPEVPAGFKVFYIINSGCQNIVGGILENGEIKLTKSSANTEVTQYNDCYSLAGARFGVYKGSTKVATITTKADGSANIVEVEAGTYTLKEDEVPRGYAKAADTTVTVQAGRVTEVHIADLPQVNPIEILLQKIDRETGAKVPMGSATLEGAEFVVNYYDMDMTPKSTNYGEPMRSWTVKTDADGFCTLDEAHFVSGDPFYHTSSGQVCIPLGMVTIQETKAPTGYLLNEKTFVRQITSDGDAELVKTYAAPDVPDQVKRGDFDFVKIEDGTMHRMANVPFTITSKTTGESHTIVTDRNGYANTASSWSKHTSNTNRGETDEDGIWFEMDKAGNKATEVDDELGALPYDTYVLDEVRCDANKGHKLVTGVEFVITKDAVTIKLGTITNDLITLQTTATDKASGTHKAKPSKTTTIIDEVVYSGLTPGKEYTLTGRLIDKSTGMVLISGGKSVTATKTFTPASASGTVTMEFTFDSSALGGKSTVVFESLSLDGKEVVAHADIKDEGQTVTFEKPETPETPNTPGTPGTPKTGDSTPLLWIAALAFASALGAALAMKRRRSSLEDDTEEIDE